jgi:hypothetical protein
MSDEIVVKERLVADACEAQRAGGREVTPRQNEELFTGLLQESDRREADTKPVTKIRDKSKEQADADFDEELSKRQKKQGIEADGLGKYEITRREVKQEAPRKRVPFGKLTMLQQRLVFEKKLLQQRMAQLKAKPEWKHQVDVCVGNLMGAKNKYERAAAVGALSELVERSNLTFGDWRKLPVQRLHFHGKAI